MMYYGNELFEDVVVGGCNTGARDKERTTKKGGRVALKS